MRALEVSLRETTAVIPEEKDPQDVLRNLHELASESSLDIASFTPKAIVAKTQYSEWPIELGLEGSYHDLGRFFDRIASMSRLMSVSDLKIKTKTKPNGRGTRHGDLRGDDVRVPEGHRRSRRSKPTDVRGRRPAMTGPRNSIRCAALSRWSSVMPASAAAADSGRHARRPSPCRRGYDDGGRRDPFVSLIVPKRAGGQRGGVTARRAHRPGVALRRRRRGDAASSESARTMMAMLEGAGQAVVRRQARRTGCSTASIKSIDAEGVVFVEQSTPARARPHEVRKTLRPAAEVIR